MPRLVRVVIALASLALLALPSAALAADVYRFRDSGASASFSTLSDDGCIATYANIFAGENVARSTQNANGTSPAPGSSSGTGIGIFQYDQCSNTVIRDASGWSLLSDQDFQMSHRLDGATLTATIEVYDYVSDTTFPVTVDLAWIGDGDITRGNNSYHYQSPGHIMNGHFNGTFRDATASGTISDGTTNFAAEASEYGSLYSAKSGSVSIDRTS